MMLAEKLLLLCWNAHAGVPADGVHPTRLRRALAAALLAELVLHRRIVGDARALRVADALPNYNALASEAARILQRAGGALAATSAVGKIDAGLPRLRARIIASLVGRDVLHAYGLPMFRRYPVRSMQALQEAHAELDAVARAGMVAAPSLALAAVLDGAGLLAARVTRADADAIRAALAGTTPLAAGDDTALLLAIGGAAEEDGNSG